MRSSAIGAAVAILAASAAWAHHAGETFPVGDLVVSHAWTYETSEAGHSTKVYMTIANHGAAADRLVRASVDFAPRAVIQAQALGADGVLAIQDVSALQIAPGQVLTLQPGALWIELEGVQQAFAHGDFFHMDLVFEQAGAVEIDVLVEESDEHDVGAS